MKFLLRFLAFFLQLISSLGICLILAFLAFPIFGLQWNESNSLPLGIYQKISKEKLEVGDIVVFCLSGKTAELTLQRRYVESVWLNKKCELQLKPLMKPIAGIANDEIRQSSNGIFVNQKLLANSKSLEKDGRGREMPKIVLPPNVPKNSLLLISSYNPNSWDSRYYGVIPTEAVISIVRPLLTFEFHGLKK